MTTDAVVTERGLRADAQRNLELILEAAAEAFAEKGHEACVADIAHRAGVGQATIFRRFETKDDLIAAVFERKIAHVLAAAEAALQKRRAWDGLREFMETAVQLQLRDRGFFQSSAQRVLGDPRIVELHAGLTEIVSQLVERAKEQGDLRRDVVAEDIPVLICATAQAGSTAAPAGADLWRRYLQIITDGLAAESKRGRLRPGPPSWDQIREGLASAP